MTLIGRTLARYFALRFARAILGVFATVFALVYLLDLVELLRRAADAPGATTGTMARLALFRVPSVAEQVLPFAVLFGSLAAFLGLSRRLELVVVRSAGVSVWGFILPALGVAVGIGLLSVGAYNPMATALKERAEAIEGRIFSRGGVGAADKGTWVRQKSVDGEAVLRADGGLQDGAVLLNVTAFVFDAKGDFAERVEAERAVLRPGHWRFERARVLTPGQEPQAAATYLLATNLDADQVRETFGSADTVSFWHLPAIVARLDLAGLDSTRYRLRHQSLLARPALFAAMVAVAAAFSLRFFRFGGVARMVLSGVAAGFMLYVASQVAGDLGGAGIISTAAAAWLPGLGGGLLGTLALLHQEDG